MAKPGDIFPLKDPIKKTLFFPKMLLESTNFWPEKRSLSAKITSWVMLAVCIVIEIGQIAFVVSNIQNITKIASAISTISTTFQAITKLSALYVYQNTLRSVLATVWFEFWPVTIASPKIIKKLTQYNQIIIGGSVVMFSTGICFAFGFLSSPLISGERILPFETVYPFDWSKSPFYEIIYVAQWMTNIAFILAGICGHDFLFVGLCGNIVGQYTLLCEVFGYLGTQKVKNINDKLATVTNFEKFHDPNRQLLRICIIHHIKVTEICEKVATVFSFSCFVQLFSSVTALCVAALIMTFAQVDVALFTVATSYLLGHLVQLFFFCTLGNEIIYNAAKFPDAIFSSQWYDTDLNVKKDVLFVLQRAQRDAKVKAMGVKVLDYQIFIAVLKLSFSFYTMLTKVTNN